MIYFREVGTLGGNTVSKKNKTVKEDIPQAPKQMPVVTFDAWFKSAKTRYKLRDYQDFAIQVFFEKQGLSEIEDPDKYDEMFKKF